MNQTDKPPTIDRIGKKQRKNLMLSPELTGVLAELVGPTNVSGFIEAAAWDALVQQYGEETVRSVVTDVQNDLDCADRLNEPKQITLTV